jgi:peptide/nickel transport system permease protein
MLERKTNLSKEDLAPTPAAQMRRRAARNISLIVGGGVVLTITLCAIFAGFIAPHDPYQQDLTARLISPVWMDGGLGNIFLGPII